MSYDDLEQQLRRALRQRADGTTVPEPPALDPTADPGRGRRLNGRGRPGIWAVAVAAVVALVAVTAGLAVGGRDRRGDVVTDTGSVAGDTDGPSSGAGGSGGEDGASGPVVDDPGELVDPGPDVPADLEARVIEAVAPLSGESMPARRWLNDATYAATVPVATACLERHGRPDLLEMHEQVYTGPSAWDPLKYPEPERILAQGLWQSEEERTVPGWTFDEETGEMGLSEDGEIVDRCGREAGGAGTVPGRIRTLHSQLTPEWDEVTIGVGSDERMLPRFEAFAECLRGEGVHEDFATGGPRTPMDYLQPPRDGLAHQYAERGEEPPWDPDDLEPDPGVYVRCGQESELFGAGAELKAEKRPTFVAEHRDEIDELVGLLGQLGYR